MMRHVSRALVIALAFSGALGAQDVDLALRPPRDSIIAQARSMVVDGQADAGRKIVDSVLAASASDLDRYSETLFWRGVLAATAADAERSYRRLLIEAPLSERAEEALLQLAQLEASRGNRRAASDHLYRYMLSYGNSVDRPARPRVSLWLVRLLFEQPDQSSRGCEAVRLSRDAIPPENIELRNQLEVYVPRCAYAQAVAAAAQDSAAAEPAGDTVAMARDTAKTTPARDTAKTLPARDTAKAPSRARPAASQPTKAAAPAPAGKSVYSVQVAAYDSREAAVRMAELLGTRGLDARVDGTQQPFRVRVGRFATRAEAVRLQQTLKAQGQNGFVTLVSKP
jgi:cell division septation protein DedD